MTTDVAVIVPWSGGDPDRERAWAFLRPRWERIGHVIEGVPPEGPWCKAAAVAAALAVTDAERLAVVDADVWTDGIHDALDALDDTAWAVPHSKVMRLNAQGTAHVIRYDRFAISQPGMLNQQPYTGIAGGGITLIHRNVYEDCPLDHRYTGWGQEDSAWGMALTRLHGRPWRGTAPLWHLWHQPQQRDSRLTGSARNRELNDRYRLARHAETLMRALVDEARMAVA